jgi:hypothetical protein
MKRPYWLLAAVVAIYLLAALVEPCDGGCTVAEDARGER